MSYLLDTSILIEIEKENQDIISRIARLDQKGHGEFYITFFNFCEFYYGAINKNERNKKRILDGLRKYRLLNTSEPAAIIFCKLLQELKKTGKQVAQFDLLIASIAIDSDLTLLTADKGFKEIPQLRTVVFHI